MTERSATPEAVSWSAALLPWGAAILAGFLLAGIHPPVAAWPLAFAVPALLALAGEGALALGRRPAVMGFTAGLLGNLLLIHWIANRAGVVAWILLALVGAAWWALLAELLAWLLQRRWTIVLAPIVWVGIDAWRGAWPFSGFGWGTLGVSQADNAWLVPVARVLGEKGLTLVVASVSLFAWVAVRDGLLAHRATPPAEDHPRPRRTRGGAAPPGGWRGRLDAATGASTFGTGGVVLTLLAVTLVTVAPPERTGSIDVLAVQGNDIEFPQGPYRDDARTVATQALDETAASIAADGPADLVVWPEGTVGLDPARDADLAAVVAEAGALTDGRLLLGTDLEDPDSTNLFRVSTVVGVDGTLGDTYRKRVLVPFGEYVPFRSLIDWYPPLRQVPRDVLPGTEATTVRVGDVDVAVGICFESMYPDAVRSNVLAGDDPAELVVISSSDSSFGRSGEPAQHVAQSRLRAIETGRWVVHATTSGITTMVDPDGATHGTTELFTVDSVRDEVGLATSMTPFLRIGDVLDPVGRAVVVLAVLAAAVLAIHRRNQA
ncbi:apolipoprotein N-acyltransferase [Salsipaludibacter albus]|uniref:apolipoprotein N-acyltransferase n=1 Tax=Salsipaludibacter albus TaxID=2849650 RepID=UPI001EE3DD34|nr:apolipoprotein N-acyltransferase [Salsipaludibacter albus]